MRRKSDRREFELPGQYEYHYSRDERLDSAPEEVRNPSWRRTGILKGNKPLKIMLLDLVVIVVGFTIVTQVLPLIRRERTLAGYRLTFSAFAYDADTLLTLRAVSTARIGQTEPALVRVRFGAVADVRGAEPEEGEVIEVQEPLSGVPGEETAVRGRLPGTAGAKRVFAEVTIRGETHRLETPVRRE